MCQICATGRMVRSVLGSTWILLRRIPKLTKLLRSRAKIFNEARLHSFSPFSRKGEGKELSSSNET